MNSKPPNFPLNRRTIRLPGYDYSTPGGYFITVVTFRRECLFGEISSGEMKLSPIGEIVRREWFKTAELRPYVELREEEFVVMPNHAHGIIWIVDNDLDGIVGARRGELVGARRDELVGARRDELVGARRDELVGARRRRAPTETTSEQFGKPTKGSIPTIVRAFKSAVTYCAGRELNSANLWQKNYYEHIIRDTPDYERIATYIAQNPENWAEDEENLVMVHG